MYIVLSGINKRISHFFVQDLDGDTLLHLACLIPNESIARPCVLRLLDAGADPMLVNFKISSPLHIAALANSVV